MLSRISGGCLHGSCGSRRQAGTVPGSWIQDAAGRGPDPLPLTFAHAPGNAESLRTGLAPLVPGALSRAGSVTAHQRPRPAGRTRARPCMRPVHRPMYTAGMTADGSCMSTSNRRPRRHSSRMSRGRSGPPVDPLRASASAPSAPAPAQPAPGAASRGRSRYVRYPAGPAPPHRPAIRCPVSPGLPPGFGLPSLTGSDAARRAARLCRLPERLAGGAQRCANRREPPDRPLTR